MKQLISFLIITLALITAPTTFASMRVFNSSGTQIGTFTDLKLANGLSVSQVSGKAQVALTAGSGTTALAGFLQAQTSTSGDLTASQCGYTITSDNAVGAAADLFNLPAISSSTLGCRYSFIVGVDQPGSGLKINPQNADKILLLANSAGDAVSADAAGESVVLEATQPGWAPVGSEKGSWVDIN